MRGGGFDARGGEVFGRRWLRRRHDQRVCHVECDDRHSFSDVIGWSSVGPHVPWPEPSRRVRAVLRVVEDRRWIVVELDLWRLGLRWRWHPMNPLVKIPVVQGRFGSHQSHGIGGVGRAVHDRGRVHARRKWSHRSRQLRILVRLIAEAVLLQTLRIRRRDDRVAEYVTIDARVVAVVLLSFRSALIHAVRSETILHRDHYVLGLMTIAQLEALAFIAAVRNVVAARLILGRLLAMLVVTVLDGLLNGVLLLLLQGMPMMLRHRMLLL